MSISGRNSYPAPTCETSIGGEGGRSLRGGVSEVLPKRKHRKRRRNRKKRRRVRAGDWYRGKGKGDYRCRCL
uniref:Uncharacterized protein n=1 Tax=Nelumbo nucifera TaxID=4432 RepID=A0A822ZT46_NELNU|nr:TPA_asm: hypothetical protein HUJ06_018030 [Nelumbo nucifera]